MYLLIDARGEEEIYVSVWNGKETPEFKTYKKGKASFLQFVISQFRNFAISSCDGVLIIPGPGSFSIVRTAVTFANTISFATQIPVVKIEVKGAETKETAFSRATDSLKRFKKTFALIMPIYGKEPNITIKKT